MTGKGGFGGSALSRRVAPETMTSRACGRVVLAIQDSNKHDCHDDGVAEGEGSGYDFRDRRILRILNSSSRPKAYDMTPEA